MPEALPRTRFRDIMTTPLGNLIRGRIKVRLNWRERLAAAELPAEIKATIVRIVTRARLWRSERAAVTDELIAHFSDGLAAGVLADRLIQTFGDERTAAKLIRRAKRRNRPLLWHAWKWSWRGAAALTAIYALLVLRFVIGHPSPTVDYVARLNQPALKTPVSDRAWPLWRTAILKLLDRDGSGNLIEPAAFDWTQDGDRWHENWPALSVWLAHHTEGLEIARQAAAKPAMGFILGPQGSAYDPVLFPQTRASADDSVVGTLLPHLNPLRTVALALSYDIRLAAEAGDGHRCRSDVSALLAMGRQIRQQNFVICDLIAIGTDAAALERFAIVLRDHPRLLSDNDLVALAHQLSGPKVASDLVNLSGEEIEFEDAVQRIYTDDGEGDGRLTLAGFRTFGVYRAVNGKNDDPDFGRDQGPAGELILPVAAASRAEVTARFDQWHKEYAANFDRPMRDRTRAAEDTALRWSHSPLDRSRYAVMMPFLVGQSRLQTTAERELGVREGTMVAISLELFYRRHGRYPQTLAELTPELLPAIPADRVTGDPLHYRLIDGKPVVYSVGADRVDDGGTPSLDRFHKPNSWLAAVWDVPAATAPHGDWVLYPPDPE